MTETAVTQTPAAAPVASQPVQNVIVNVAAPAPIVLVAGGIPSALSVYRVDASTTCYVVSKDRSRPAADLLSCLKTA